MQDNRTERDCAMRRNISSHTVFFLGSKPHKRVTSASGRLSVLQSASKQVCLPLRECVWGGKQVPKHLLIKSGEVGYVEFV